MTVFPADIHRLGQTALFLPAIGKGCSSLTLNILAQAAAEVPR
jgi:hypothetical protein